MYILNHFGQIISYLFALCLGGALFLLGTFIITAIPLGLFSATLNGIWRFLARKNETGMKDFGTMCIIFSVIREAFKRTFRR